MTDTEILEWLICVGAIDTPMIGYASIMGDARTSEVRARLEELREDDDS